VVSDVQYVNTGSVGRPKDGDPRAGYVALSFASDGSVSIEIRRVTYDVERASTGILDSDLPNEFADFLRHGGQTPAAAAIK
jgi:diadenosine tetraphosphatase ApaH/serine/threonine PP2A family protein phosphatase